MSDASTIRQRAEQYIAKWSSCPGKSHAHWEACDILADLLTLLDASSGSQGWQDIATAPKDREVLGYRASGGWILITRWNDPWQAWVYSGALREWQPTHWMPLPDPPSGSQGEQKDRSGAVLLDATATVDLENGAHLGHSGARVQAATDHGSKCGERARRAPTVCLACLTSARDPCLPDLSWPWARVGKGDEAMITAEEVLALRDPRYLYEGEGVYASGSGEIVRLRFWVENGEQRAEVIAQEHAPPSLSTALRLVRGKERT